MVELRRSGSDAISTNPTLNVGLEARPSAVCLREHQCKICGSSRLRIFAHTAHCQGCGVLLYYPYPKDDLSLVEEGIGKAWSADDALSWYTRSAALNHANFTRMLRFATGDRVLRGKVLDYGGGGGQFAVVCKSHFPDATIYITDISDSALLPQWAPFNVQIPFRSFGADTTTFDYIFMNDVFEHVSDPVGVLRLLASRLNPGGKLFIDTPKQFWIYPVTKAVSTRLYRKVLRGTVTPSHLQIWTRGSFVHCVKQSGLQVAKYEEASEYTMPPDYYLKNMGITSAAVRAAGRLFYSNAKHLARNKILCLLTR